MGVRIACLFVATMLALGEDPPAEVRSKKEWAALQGTWKVVSLESDGKARDFPENPLRWVIKGNKVLYGGAELAVLTLDVTTMPQSMDLGFLNPKRVLEGVYAVDEDTLKICVNRQTEGVKERPLGFSTEGKPDWRLL